MSTKDAPSDKEQADMTTDYDIPERFTHVFIGKPHYQKGQVCRAYEKWRKEGPPPPVHDATIFANRHYVNIDVVEVVHGPEPSTYPNHLAHRKDEEDTSFRITVRFPLESGAFAHIAPLPFDQLDMKPYGERVCEPLDALLAHPYVVLGGYQVYEDYGNSGRIPSRWDDLGVDPTGPHKGFDTLAKAQEYASKLKKEP